MNLSHRNSDKYLATEVIFGEVGVPILISNTSFFFIETENRNYLNHKQLATYSVSVVYVFLEN